MKIRFAESTGVPYGQFVVEAENAQERAILQTFLWPSHHAEKDWRFVLHGYGWQCYHGAHSGPASFNFGWARSSPTQSGGEK